MPLPCSFQCLLGKPTAIVGAVASALGAAVGLGALGWLSQREISGTGAVNYSIMVISNSLSLTSFSVMLLVAFSCPNEKYANFFGFLQFAAGKAVLLSFGGILQIAVGVLFAGLKETLWIGILIYISAGIMYLAMILVILRACCYENNQAIIMQAATSAAVSRQAKNSRSAAKTNMSTRNPASDRGSEFGNNTGRPSDYEAPAIKQSSSQNEIAEDAFGSDNPFS